jgi:hypothetical protein
MNVIWYILACTYYVFSVNISSILGSLMNFALIFYQIATMVSFQSKQFTDYLDFFHFKGYVSWNFDWPGTAELL